MTSEANSCGNCEQLRRQLADKEQQIQALLAKLKELGQFDGLTGALNQRGWMDFLAGELQRAQRTGHPFCVAVIKLDQYKTIAAQDANAGELLLKASSDTALKILRTIDRFGHFENEYFGIVLPATWLDQAVIAMRRLTAAIAACPIDGFAPGIKLSFSGGLTTNAFGDTAELITERAKQALVQAEQEGGGRVVQVELPLPDVILPPD